ncbi:MAG: hypothetical protein ACJ74O_11120 [Frankiaceae bacterium]
MGSRDDRRAARLRALLAHVPFLAVLLAGAALRVLTMVAYRPAFLFPDSRGYLKLADHLSPGILRPLGYSILVRVIPHHHALWPIVLVQHLLGLAMGAAIYAVLLRRGVRPWLAALAAVPILLDSWQIDIEHYVLSDVLFQVLLLSACLVLLLRERPGVPEAAVAGLLLGAAGAVRSAGLPLAAAAALAVLLASRRWRSALAVLVAAAVPLGGYAAWYHHVNGDWTTNGAKSRFLYARVATFADCRALDLPAYEWPLCPAEPLSQRLGVNWYMWSRHSPQNRYQPPAGRTKDAVLADFDHRVLRHQPVTYASVVASDFLRGFGPTRTIGPKDADQRFWRFADAYPDYNVPSVLPILAKYGAEPSVRHGPARFLTAYGKVAYVPGPLLGACLLAAALAAAGAGRARRSELRGAAAVLAVTAAVVLLTAAAVQFSWRYQIQQLPLLAPAGALAATALVRGGSRNSVEGEARVTDTGRHGPRRRRARQLRAP